MKEIEIRMWNGVSKKYHYDVENVFTCLAQQNVFDNKMTSRGFTVGYNHIGEGSVFEQFTGLLDKNGNKIFEGDIVKIEIPSWNKNITQECEIVFKNGCFCYLHKSERTTRVDGLAPKVKVEIIGNIHIITENMKYSKM